MPYINGPYYMNPNHGAATERSRQTEAGGVFNAIAKSIETGATRPLLEEILQGAMESSVQPDGQNGSSQTPKIVPASELYVDTQSPAQRQPHGQAQNASDGHWITIDHRHVLIQESNGNGPKHFIGDATYYDLPGSKTASGKPFDRNHMSAAMTGEKARIGQHVIVTYSHKDPQGKTISKSITVVVDDQGPFARDSHGSPMHPLRPDPHGVIDLTPAAFRALIGSLKQGRVPVTVTVPNE